MSHESEYLKVLYRGKTEEELLAIHGRGSLTDLAFSILEAELDSRGVKAPRRPEETMLSEAPAPAWFRAGVLLFVLFLSNLVWVFVLRPIIGAGFLQQVIFVLLPAIFIWRKLFPKKSAPKQYRK